LEGLFGKDQVCGVVASETSRQMIAQLGRGLRKTRTLELRLDYLRSAKERVAFLAWLKECIPSRAVLIATCRRQEGGGKFQGSREEQIEILAQAARSGCDWCDVEIETAGHISRDRLAQALSPARVIISYHDFHRTPKNFLGIVRRLERSGRDAVKVAGQCVSVSDSLRICELARRRNVIAIPMGEFGLAGRILSLRMGSALTYAAVEQTTAPGQISLDAMTDLYRPALITRRTRVYGVIGDPVGHSLSPLMHNAAFRTRKVDAVFVPFLVRDLREFLSTAKGFGVAGFAVTIPHKESILRFLHECDPLAARIGAVNTVAVRGGGRLYGYNTDYVGVLRSLERRMRLKGSCVLLFGAGGAARAAAFALAASGSVVCICARRPERARALARAAGGQVVKQADLKHEFFDAIVNCTPIGMHPHSGSPLASPELNCRIVMDMVYRPRETELLRLARKKKIEVISGVEMFLAQGIAQHEIWTGHRAPESAMRRVVEGKLDEEEKLKRRRS
jgi:3-dehydroquinate dehydratase/shikimate dehydrogenase